MALLKSLIIAILCCVVLIKSDITTQESGQKEGNVPHISAVLDYLNSNPNKVYNYKRGSLLSAQNKADIVEVSAEIEVDCNGNQYPEIPCNEHVLICQAFLGSDPYQPGAYYVLSDVRCRPKIEITVEDVEASKSYAPMAFGEQNLGNGKVDLSNEAVPPELGSPDFVAIRRDTGPCLGCPFDLNKDAEGVGELIDTALKHIESEKKQRHKVTNIRRLQQQVVSGLKYILLAEVAQTTCAKDAEASASCALDVSVEPFICEVIFIEKPWISKSKHIIKNNCTLSQEFESHSRQDRDDIGNEISTYKDPTPDVNQQPKRPNYDVENGGDINHDRLADLESQILLGGILEAPTKSVATPNFKQNEYVSVDEPLSISTDIDSLSVEPLNTPQTSDLRTLYVSMPAVDEVEPFVQTYTRPNEYVTSGENFAPDNSRFITFDSYFPIHDRLVRELSGDSNSDSDSTAEKKGKVIVKRDVANTSEEDSNSNDTKEDDKRVKRDTRGSSSEESSETKNKGKSDSDSNSDEKNKIKEEDIETTTLHYTTLHLIKRDVVNTSEEESKSSDSDEKHKHTKRDVANTSEEGSKSSDSAEKDKRTKREVVNTSEEDSKSSDSDEKHKRTRRDVANTSEEDSNSHNTSEKDKRTRRDTKQNTGSSSSSSSSESKEKNREQASKNWKDQEEIQKKKSDDTSESSSDSSSEEKQRKNRRDYDPYREGDNEVRPRRSIGQLEKISSDEKVIVRDLADFAAATLDNIDDDHHKRVILQILGAKKLKLDGIYYQIILRLGISHCHENEHYENCREKLFTNLTKICKVQVHVEDDYSSPKVVKSQCQNIKKDENDRNRTNYSRYRRSILLGDPTPISIYDNDVNMFLGETKRELMSYDDKQLQINATRIVWKALGYLSSKTEPGHVYKLINISEVHVDSLEPRFWDIKAQIALCDQFIVKLSFFSGNFTHCPNKHVTCRFLASERMRSLDGLKMNISCENDEQVYFYEPVEGLEQKFDLDQLETTFRQFALKYNKIYRDEMEFKYRLKVFRDNLNKIGLLNKYEKGTGRYGITRFADLTEREFSKSHGYRPDLRNDNELPFAQAKIPKIELPTEFDWRNKGAVTEVKNQGMCGSCWAFSVTGNVEGQYAIKYGKLLEFSEQELVDCDKVDEGCNGGLMDTAYRVIEKLGGLETESDYPYEGDDETCHFSLNKVQVQLSAALNISHNETDMAKWLVGNGPISIAINANAMQFYMGGVSHPWKSLCNPNNLDHGVLIVGYGVHKYSLFNKTLPYWIVKNSWGESWGEQGYYRVYRGDGTCGLNQTPSSAIVA